MKFLTVISIFEKYVSLVVKKGNSHITDLVKSLIGENPLNTIVFICLYVVTLNGRINIIFCIYAENGLYRKLLALR